MKIVVLVILLLLPGIVWASMDNRYLERGKVLYENPLRHDVFKVNVSMGYCTVLEFSEKPMLVTVGDNSLIQVEIPQNSKSVVIKPLTEAGQTNLFVFTPGQRFNYKVVIGAPQDVDYVVDATQSLKDRVRSTQRLSMSTILKMARSYGFLKEHHLINDREFVQKNIFYQCAYPKVNIDVIEAFNYKNPHYLFLHIVVHNLTDDAVNLSEKDTSILIHEEKFSPQYVLFDNDKLNPKTKTDGWLILENSLVSIDNKFSLSVGVEDEEYVCKQSIS